MWIHCKVKTRLLQVQCVCVWCMSWFRCVTAALWLSPFSYHPTWIFPPATLEITDQYDADLPMNDLHLDREYQWKILAMTSTTIVF